MEPSTTILLRRTPPTRRLAPLLLMMLLGGLPGLGLPLLWFTFSGALPPELSIVVFVAAFIAALGWLARLFVLPAPVPVVVDDAALTLPFGRRVARLPLEELIVCRVDGGDLVLLAVALPGQPQRSDAGSFVVPARCFKDKQTGAVDVVAAVRARLGVRAHGAALLDRLDENEARQRDFAKRRPLVTWGIAAVCVVVFGVEVAVGAVVDPRALLLMGANAPALVMQGEVWRLVASCLLHGSLVHLAMNLAALLSTGALLERWLGRAGFAVVVVVTGVVSQLGSTLAARADMSVGLSGALFGFLGVLLASTIRFRGQAVGGVRVPLSSWIFLLITNGALSMLPFVDVVAHGTGFVAGVGCGVLLAPRPGLPPLLRARARTVVAVVAVVCVAAAIVVAAATAIAGGVGSAAG